MQLASFAACARCLVVVLVSSTGACSDPGRVIPPRDGSGSAALVDAATGDAQTDAIDAGAGDAAPGDAAPDASVGDAPPDAFVMPDAPADAAPDAFVPMDAPADAAPDAAPDAFVFMDAPPDAFVPADAPPDAFVPIDAPPVDAPPASPGTVIVYPEGRRHSPITDAIANRLQAIAAAASQAADVFAKVGDSNSAADAFVRCFSEGPVDLGANGSLQPTVDFFEGGNAAGTSPYTRTSFAAVSGSTARDALSGSPSPFVREVTAISPRYAAIMFGTNNVRFGETLDEFGADLWNLVDQAISRGVIPILTTIPPINGSPGLDARIPTFNRVIRAIAQGRRVLLIDLHAALVSLPSRGLVADGIHLNIAPGGGCVLTSAGLQHGHNVRNLFTLEALGRARAALQGTVSDGAATVRAGSGRLTDPFVGAFPLVDLGDNRSGEASFASYACNGAAQLGSEVVYRFEVPATRTVVASVIDRGGVDVDVHILTGAATPTACAASGTSIASAVVGPGTAYVVVDAPTVASSGEYLLVVELR